MGKYYAVHKGRTPGIYFSWEDCKKQVEGYPGNVYKCFPTVAVAELFAKKGPLKYKLAVRTLLHRDAWVISSDDEDEYINSCNAVNKNNKKDDKESKETTLASSNPDNINNSNNSDQKMNNTPSNNNVNSNNNNNNSEKDDNRPPICQFYMSQRGCRFGDNCRFYHPPNDDSPEQCYDDSDSDDSDDVPLCVYWQRGYCGRGNCCPFYHD